MVPKSGLIERAAAPAAWNDLPRILSNEDKRRDSRLGRETTRASAGLYYPPTRMEQDYPKLISLRNRSEMR